MRLDDWSEGSVLLGVDAGVALIELNRPDRGNAWNDDLERRYFEALEYTAESKAVRAVVVTGRGKCFCVGADMDGLDTAAKDQGASANLSYDHTSPLRHPKPLIAAINGACAGIGLVHALMCDVRYATPSAKFTTAFSRRGLIAEHGMSWVLPRLVGLGNSADLLLSGRVIQGQEAKRMGLVNDVCPPDELLDLALSYAQDLARECSPSSMLDIKRQLYGHVDLSLQEALKESNALMRASFLRDDFAEGVTSFVERRAPDFSPITETLDSRAH